MYIKNHRPSAIRLLFPLANAHLLETAAPLLSTAARILRTKMTRAAAIALAHGGGPMPVLGDPSHREIIQSLKVRVPALLRLGTAEAPRAMVVVTAHWSTANPTVSNAAKHKLLFDYSGFPPQSYSLVYDAPGSPEVAMELFEALKAEGLTPELDGERGELGHHLPTPWCRPMIRSLTGRPLLP